LGQQVQVRKKIKAPWTMVMQIANAHSFSIGFIGIQLTHGYVAALALSSVCVIVGMIVSLLPHFGGQLLPAVAAGIPLGVVIAFVFDAMTMFGLKMIAESKRWKKAFAFVLVAVGIFLSTMAGDQMWSLVYNDWHGWVLAASVSCVIIMVDVWHPEHEAAVKKATTQPDAMQRALNTEVEIVIDRKLRQFTHEHLNSPEMETQLREKSEENLAQLIEAKFAQRLDMLAGGKNGELREISVSEESRRQIAAPKDKSKRMLYRELHDDFAKFMDDHPRAGLKMIREEFGVEESTASEWRKFYREEKEANASGTPTNIRPLKRSKSV
jgi:hypothetical protein